MNSPILTLTVLSAINPAPKPYNRLLACCAPIEMFIDGVLQPAEKSCICFVPGNALCQMASSTSQYCIDIISAHENELLQLVEAYFTYRPIKAIPLLDTEAKSLDLLINAPNKSIDYVGLGEQLQLLLRQNISLKKIDVLKALDFIHSIGQIFNTIEPPELNVNNLAAQMFMDESTLWRKCMQALNLSPQKMIAHWRYSIAVRLLLTTNLKLVQVAEHAGYANAEYLSSVIKKMSGRTPTDLKSIHSIL